MRYKCSKCNANRGVAKYFNTEYCFSCKQQSTTKNLLKHHNTTKSKELEEPINDCYELKAPKEYLEWLLKYELTPEICENHRIFWSDYYQRLVFPYYSNGVLMAAWMRTLIRNRKDKWLYYGDKELIWRFNCNKNKEVCLVEDVISAIKLSQIINTICLGGTKLKVNLPKSVKVLIWLDGDKAGQTGSQEIRHQLKLGNSVEIITSQKDPKEYSLAVCKSVLKCNSNA